MIWEDIFSYNRTVDWRHFMCTINVRIMSKYYDHGCAIVVWDPSRVTTLHLCKAVSHDCEYLHNGVNPWRQAVHPHLKRYSTGFLS
jgi:hypothetical protein